MRSGIILSSDEVRHIIAEHFEVSDDDVIKAKFSYIVADAKGKYILNNKAGGRKTMNFDALKISALGAIDALLEGVTYKSLIAALLAILLHKHSVLFLAFSALVFIDCFTRWMSLSSKRLESLNGEKPTVLQIIKGIKAARSEGLISSEVMKHRFIGKIIVYILCVLAGVLVDVTMLALGQPTWAVPLIVGYLVVTELLSICENLNDAGIEAVGEIAALVKRRRG